MDDPNTIILGGKPYPIAPLSLGQMRRFSPCFMRMSLDTVEGMDAQLTVIFHGMSAANPALKMEDIDAIKGVSFAELGAATRKIGTLCGLSMATKDTASGEAKPEGAPAEQASQDGTGSISTQS